MNVVDGILENVRRRPEAVAIEPATGNVVTYGEFGRRIGAVAAGLRASGVAPGSVLAIDIDDPVDLLSAIFGTMLAGITALVLDPPASPADRRRLLAQSDVAAVLVHGAEAEPPLRTVTLADVMAAGAGADPSAVRHPGGSVAAQVHPSSGTTGPSKAAPVTHERLLRRTRAAAAAFGVNAADRFLPIVDLRFVMGRQSALRVLDAGGTVVVRPIGSSAEEVIRTIVDARITYLTLTPSHARYLLERLPQAPGPALPAVERLNVTAAVLNRRDRGEILTKLTPNLFIAFGSNEVGNAAVAGPADLARFPDTVGRPLPGIEIGIVDEDGQPVPAGTIGEVRMRGPNIAAGYLGDEAATRRGHRDGWFHFGDTGWMNEEGYLFLAGRLDDRINYGGMKVYPIEIEEALLAHPAVVDVAAFGVPSERFQERPAAAVVLSMPVTADALRDHCRARLGAQKSPRQILLLDRLPRNPTGKVLVRELREEALRRRSARSQTAGTGG